MRRPGIEPGSQEWESCMIPLHQRRKLEMPGIEPGAFHMRSERSTTEPHPQTSPLSDPSQSRPAETTCCSFASNAYYPLQNIDACTQMLVLPATVFSDEHRTVKSIES